MSLIVVGNWVTTMKTAMALLTTIDLGPVRFPNGSLSSESIEVMKKQNRQNKYTERKKKGMKRNKEKSPDHVLALSSIHGIITRLQIVASAMILILLFHLFPFHRKKIKIFPT